METIANVRDSEGLVPDVDSRIPVLDHGYVEAVEFWGSDARVIEAARMSTNKGFQGWGGEHIGDCVLVSAGAPVAGACPECGGKPGDEKLLAYLYNHKHMTPFEMAGLVIEVQAPIFVFREWHRHRTQSYNEMSARYVPLPDVNYMPTEARLQINNTTNKQAGNFSGGQLSDHDAFAYRTQLAIAYRAMEDLYRSSLDAGVPKELARLCIPVGRYSRMRASATLRNWLAFLTLRMDENAQWEIRQYATAVGAIVADVFPRTWALFSKG